MDQLWLRGFDKELARRIRELARREHVSLNKAALCSCAAAPVSSTTYVPRGRWATLSNDFIARWSAADEKHLLRSVRRATDVLPSTVAARRASLRISQRHPIRS